MSNLDEVLSGKAGNGLDKVNALLKTGNPIVLLGTGNLGRKIGNYLANTLHKKIVYCDNNAQKWGTTVSNTPVIAPAQAVAEYGGSCLLLVCIWSPGHAYAQSKKQLEDLGARNIVHAAAIMQLYASDLLPFYHFQTPEYFIAHKEQIKTVYNLLADEESRRQYLAHVHCRINLDFEHLPVADIHNQYFPSGVFDLSTGEVFLDAGAYTGDTLSDFVRRTDCAFEKYIALEPDPVNFQKLQANAASYPCAGNIECLPLAVGKDNCTLRFDATSGSGAGASATGTLEVQCVKIDDRFYNAHPTYLKFDIEGAEMDALYGAERTIADHMPKLAVCIYHLPDDLWHIPLYLHDKYPFYKLYVRTHQADGLDFVLYAIPA